MNGVCCGTSVHNMSLPFDHACCLDKSELEACLRFLVSRETVVESYDRSRSLSISFFFQSSIRCCPPTPRPSTQAAHPSRQDVLESSCSCFSLLVGFFGFILTLGIFDSRGSSSSSFPTSTCARDSPAGSMLSPIGATSRCRVFLGLQSALLCHPRFPAADTSSHKTMISIIHIVGLCRFHFSVQVEMKNVIFEIDWSEFFLVPYQFTYF